MGRRDLHVASEAVVQPCSDEVAPAASASEYLLVAAPAAQITRPATPTWLLAVDVAIMQPRITGGVIPPGVHVSHPCEIRPDETVTRRSSPVGVNTEIRSTSTARERSVGADCEAGEMSADIHIAVLGQPTPTSYCCTHCAECAE